MSSENQKPWVAIAIAVIGLASALGVAYINYLGNIEQSSTDDDASLSDTGTGAPSLPGSDNSVSGEESPETDLPTVSTVTDSKNGILFELESCTQEDDTLTCELLVTDTRAERTLYIYSRNSSVPTRVIDVNANQTTGSEVKFGDASGRSNVRQPLVQNIALRAAIIFEGTQIQDDTVNLVEIGVYTAEDNYFSARFNDVPVKR